MAIAPPSLAATTVPTSQSMDLPPSPKQPSFSDSASVASSSSPGQSSRFSGSPSFLKDSDSQIPGSRSEEYRQLFHLPPEEVLIQDFNCALQESILLQGHMYVFDRYLCFYANIFGFETKKVIPFHEVANVRRAKTAGIFPNAIEIIASGRKHFFASFLSRDEAFKLIAERWSLYCESVKGVSDEQDSKSEITSYMNGVVLLEKAENGELPVNDLNSKERKVEKTNLEDVKLPSSAEDDDVTSISLEVQDSMEPNKGVIIEEKVTSVTSTKWIEEATDSLGVSKSYTLVAESKFPIKVGEFFNLFFSDGAIGFVESYHKRCGDKDFKCSKWTPHDKFGITREISFQHPIKIYLGAKYGGCKELQRYQVHKNSHLVIRTSQEVNDVPFSDYFHVEGNWDVERDGDLSSESCILRVHVKVVFSKKTIWRGKIEQSTLDECREAYAIWIDLAHELLKQKNIKKGQDLGTAVCLPKSGRISLDNPGKISEPSARSCENIEGESILNPVTGSADSSQQNGNEAILLNTSGASSLSRALRLKFCSFLKSQGNLQILLVAIFVLILLLMQLSIVVLLSRPQQMHVIPQADHMANVGSVGSQRKAEGMALLEKRIHLLKDEMLLVEAQLDRMRDEHLLLKMQLQDLEHQNRQT
ncbi:GRAM domain-containing protein [Dionaea muscipula]